MNQGEPQTPPKEFTALIRDLVNRSAGDRVARHLLAGDVHDLWNYVREHPRCLTCNVRTIL